MSIGMGVLGFDDAKEVDLGGERCKCDYIYSPCDGIHSLASIKISIATSTAKSDRQIAEKYPTMNNGHT